MAQALYPQGLPLWYWPRVIVSDEEDRFLEAYTSWPPGQWYWLQAHEADSPKLSIPHLGREVGTS